MNCECGCGLPTRNGSRFIQFHHLSSLHESMRGPTSPLWKGGRLVSSYVRIYTPGHQKADVNGYVYEHILIAEAALGRPLVARELVHHVDENGTNNANDNLVVCPNDAYHMLLHQRQRALDACGNANWRKCRHCGAWDDPTALYIKGNNVYHRACFARYMRHFKARKRMEATQ